MAFDHPASNAQVLKNSMVFKEIATEWIFLMKDLASVDEAEGWAQKYTKEDISF